MPYNHPRVHALAARWLEDAAGILVGDFCHEVSSGLIAHPQAAVSAHPHDAAFGSKVLKVEFQAEGLPIQALPHTRAAGMILTTVAARDGSTLPFGRPQMTLRRSYGSPHAIEELLEFNTGYVSFGGNSLPRLYGLRVAAEMCGVLAAGGVLLPEVAEANREDLVQHAQALARFSDDIDALRAPLSDILRFSPTAATPLPQVANG